MTGQPRLACLDGRLAGQQIVLARTANTLGVDPRCDVPLLPDERGTVAARHAVILRASSGWILRDLGSPPGTWLNGQRLSRESRLTPGDTFRLGESGPAFRFELGTGPASLREYHRDPRVQRARRVRRLLAGVVFGLLIGLGWGAWRLGLIPWGAHAEQNQLVARIDSLRAHLQAAQAREAGIAGELAAALAAADSAREAVRRGTAGATLARLVDSLAARNAVLRRAAEFDLPAVVAAHRGAVALLVAEPSDLRPVSGTAVAIARRGDTSWVLTSRHLVVDSAGRPARRIGLAFDGSAQVFEALLVRSDPDYDLSLLRLVIRGGTPVIPRLAEEVALGTPLAVVTFPLGFDAATSDWRREGVTASAFTATVAQRTDGRLVLEGFGTRGMSGSPVLTGAGAVAGLVFGGVPGSEGRLVVAVPAAAIRRLLAAEGIRLE
jgi:pSer/pThr/pTyr-binding forkhead associated (FHA) protein